MITEYLKYKVAIFSKQPRPKAVIDLAQKLANGFIFSFDVPNSSLSSIDAHPNNATCVQIHNAEGMQQLVDRWKTIMHQDAAHHPYEIWTQLQCIDLVITWEDARNLVLFS